MSLKLSDFDYNLPEELIAQHPVKPRDHSRLLVMMAKTKLMFHQRFFNCVDYMEAGDVLVLNDSKVMEKKKQVARWKYFCCEKHSLMNGNAY